MALNQKNMKIIFDTNKINALVLKGQDMLIDPKAEQYLIDFLDGYDRYQEALDLLKKEIIKRGKEMFPDFHAVKGDKIRMYTKKLERYTAEKTPKTAIKEFCKEISFLKLDQAKVEEYVAREKKLPEGIFEKEETETLIISRKKE